VTRLLPHQAGAGNIIKERCWPAHVSAPITKRLSHGSPPHLVWRLHAEALKALLQRRRRARAGPPARRRRLRGARGRPRGRARVRTPLAARRRPRGANRGARDVGRAGQAGQEGRRVHGVRGGRVGVGGRGAHRRARGSRRRGAPVQRLERPAVVKAGQVLRPRFERAQLPTPGDMSCTASAAAQAWPQPQQPEARRPCARSSTGRDDRMEGSSLAGTAVSHRPVLDTLMPPQGRRAPGRRRAGPPPRARSRARRRRRTTAPTAPATGGSSRSARRPPARSSAATPRTRPRAAGPPACAAAPRRLKQAINLTRLGAPKGARTRSLQPPLHLTAWVPGRGARCTCRPPVSEGSLQPGCGRGGRPARGA